MAVNPGPGPAWENGHFFHETAKILQFFLFEKYIINDAFLFLTQNLSLVYICIHACAMPTVSSSEGGPRKGDTCYRLIKLWGRKGVLSPMGIWSDLGSGGPSGARGGENGKSVF
jgi:hypothetical protein